MCFLIWVLSHVSPAWQAGRPHWTGVPHLSATEQKLALYLRSASPTRRHRNISVHPHRGDHRRVGTAQRPLMGRALAFVRVWRQIGGIPRCMIHPPVAVYAHSSVVRDRLCICSRVTHWSNYMSIRRANGEKPRKSLQTAANPSHFLECANDCCNCESDGGTLPSRRLHPHAPVARRRVRQARALVVPQVIWRPVNGIGRQPPDTPVCLAGEP